MKLWLKQTLLALCVILVTVSAALYWFTAVQTESLLDQALDSGNRQLTAFAGHLDAALMPSQALLWEEAESVRAAMIQYHFAAYARLLQSSDVAYALVLDGAYLYNISGTRPAELLPMPEDALTASCAGTRNGDPCLVLARRERLLNLPVTLYLTLDTSATHAAINRLAHTAQAALFVCLMLCGVLLALVFRRSLMPLRRLTGVTRQIAEGDYALRSELRTADEVGELSQSFDSMAETIEQKILSLEDTARRRELLLGAMTHEMKTPMTAIIGYSESLLTLPLTEERRIDAIREIHDAARRTERLSQKMMQLIALTDCPAMECSSVSPNALLEAAAQAVEPALRERHIALRLHCHAPALMGDADLLFTLLTNLIDNAAKASPSGAEVVLSAGKAADRVRLTVSDHGRGIPADKIRLVTEPFYRVDKARSRKLGGAGLGLTLCRMIADAHGTALVISSEPGRGTDIWVDLPCAHKEENP